MGLVSLLVKANRKPITATLTTALPIAVLSMQHAEGTRIVWGVALAAVVTLLRLGYGYETCS